MQGQDLLNDTVKYLDLSNVYGSLSLYGSDTLDLLDRLTTNNLTDLTDVGMGMGSVLTSNKGRIIDLLYVFKLPDYILVITSYDACKKVKDWIEFYTIMEDVVVEENCDRLSHHRVSGAGIVELFPQMSGLNPFELREIVVGSIPCLAFMPDVKSPSSIDLLVQSESAAEFINYWTERADFIDGDGFDRIRINEGVPVYGKELTDKFNPLEAGLIRHISFNKGCYIGQEVVARLNTYDKVQRQLVKLSLQTTVDNPAIQSEETTVGLITSTNSGKGLGYVKNAYATKGTVLKSGECVVEVLGTV
jgi:hypothetical protein